MFVKRWICLHWAWPVHIRLSIQSDDVSLLRPFQDQPILRYRTQPSNMWTGSDNHPPTLGWEKKKKVHISPVSQNITKLKKGKVQSVPELKRETKLTSKCLWKRNGILPPQVWRGEMWAVTSAPSWWLKDRTHRTLPCLVPYCCQWWSLSE